MPIIINPIEENILANVITFCIETNVKVLFICNMVDSSYENNRFVIQTFLNEGVDVIGIELGNELYLKRHQTNSFPNPKVYTELAFEYHQKLKRDFPNIKTCIIAAPLKVIASNQNRASYYDEWNKAIMELNFFDAYSIHHYCKSEDCKCNEDAPFRSEAHRLAMFECFKLVLLNELDMWFNKALPTYNEMFSDKEMWITEWSTTMLHKYYGNTQLGNLYFSTYLFELAIRSQNPVYVASFHNWLGRGNFFPAIGVVSNSIRFEKRSSYPLLQLLKPIFENGDVLNCAIPREIIQQLNSERKAYLFTNRGDKKKLYILCIVNFSEESFELDISSILLLSNNSNTEKNYLRNVYSSQLDASIGAKIGRAHV